MYDFLVNTCSGNEKKSLTSAEVSDEVLYLMTYNHNGEVL